MQSASPATSGLLATKRELTKYNLHLSESLLEHLKRECLQFSIACRQAIPVANQWECLHSRYNGEGRYCLQRGWDDHDSIIVILLPAGSGTGNDPNVIDFAAFASLLVILSTSN